MGSIRKETSFCFQRSTTWIFDELERRSHRKTRSVFENFRVDRSVNIWCRWSQPGLILALWIIRDPGSEQRQPGWYPQPTETTTNRCSELSSSVNRVLRSGVYGHPALPVILLKLGPVGGFLLAQPIMLDYLPCFWPTFSVRACEGLNAGSI